MSRVKYPNAKHARNAEIVRRVRMGEKQLAIAAEFGISSQRVNQIWRKAQQRAA